MGNDILVLLAMYVTLLTVVAIVLLVPDNEPKYFKLFNVTIHRDVDKK
jgi:hypothetical protein